MEMVMSTETAEYTFQTALPFTQTPTIASRDDSNDEVYFETKPFSDKLLLWNTYGSMELSIVGGSAAFEEIRESFYMQKGIVLTPRVKPEAEPFLRRVGAFIMPFGVPTYLENYAKEMNDVVEPNKFKLWVTVAMTTFTAIFGVQLSFLIVGLFVIAFTDMILSLIPGNVKPGTEKDHAMQAKVMSFSTNFVMLVGVVVACHALERFLGDFKALSIISSNLYYPVASWIFGVYIWRMIGYAARANNTKVPQSIKKLFDKDLRGK